MALGSGRFVTRDKTFPGIYVKLSESSTILETSRYTEAFLGFGILGSMMLG